MFDFDNGPDEADGNKELHHRRLLFGDGEMV